MSSKIFLEKSYHKILNRKLANFYSSRFKEHGPDPASVLWQSYGRQSRRFEIIVDNIIKAGVTASDTLVDIGCGYGAFLKFLHSRKDLSPAHYYGLDISKEMIEFCRKTYRSKNVSFFNVSNLGRYCSLSVISGAFNRAATRNLFKWENYVASNLLNIWRCTQKTMVFNMQHTPLKKSLITNDMIYYISETQLSALLDRVGAQYWLVYDAYLPNDITIIIRRI